MKPRIAVVTSGHLSTCPRMVKAADALHAHGYDVSVVSCVFEPWAEIADRELEHAPWHWRTVRYDVAAAPTTYFASGIRRRAGRLLAGTYGLDRLPFGIAARAFSRVHSQLVAAIEAVRPEFVYAGTAGALAAAAEAADGCGIRYGLDLEDFHSGECERGDTSIDSGLARTIERRVLAGAAVLTASSPLIAAAYRAEHGVDPIPVHNTFSLPAAPLPPVSSPVPRLYWFSQTIGPTRGLEQVIAALGLVGTRVELQVRGKSAPGYIESLRALQRQVAPRVELVVDAPASPSRMIQLCGSASFGLSFEQVTTRNRELCLGNKVFTYLAAARPVVLSDTPAHRMLAGDICDAALICAPGDVDGLAAGLQRWIADRGRLAGASETAWTAARRRWHWEHPLDRGALVAAISRALSERAAVAS